MGTKLGPRLNGDRYIASLRRDGEALAAAADGNLDAAVPGCPDWNVGDLVWHTARLHHYWSTIVRDELQSPKDVVRPQRPPGEDLIEWYRGSLTTMVSILKSAAPSSKVWTWTYEKNVAWVRRRMAQETAVHRWDAQSAVGSPQPIDADIAADGIDEYFEFFIRDVPDQGSPAPELSVHLHATDVEGEWFARMKDNHLEVRHSHEKADVAARGEVSQLLLLLWGRIPEAEVEVLGDRAALFAFLQLADLS